MTQGGTQQGGTVGSTETATYYLCKSSVSFCDSDGQNDEGTVTATDYSDSVLEADVLRQHAAEVNLGEGDFAAGWQVNQWTVEVSKTLPASELDKVEKSLSSAVITMNQGYPAPFHAKRIY